MPPDGSSYTEPLSPQAFHILISLYDNELHGYGIIRRVDERTAGAIRLSASTLYGAIKRMLGEGLIEESEERPDPAHDDGRRKYYRVTAKGRKAVAAEGRRITQLARLVEERGLLGDQGAAGA